MIGMAGAEELVDFSPSSTEHDYPGSWDEHAQQGSTSGQTLRLIAELSQMNIMRAGSRPLDEWREETAKTDLSNQ